jgi:hypothetical protein
MDGRRRGGKRGSEGWKWGMLGKGRRRTHEEEIILHQVIPKQLNRQRRISNALHKRVLRVLSPSRLHVGAVEEIFDKVVAVTC